MIQKEKKNDKKHNNNNGHKLSFSFRQIDFRLLAIFPDIVSAYNYKEESI